MSIENYGKYQLLKRLAMGGMAQIYLARQRGSVGSEKLLVVKRILPHLTENADFVRMFLDEARIAARLDHPNIVKIYDLGAQDDSFFIAMEYIHGEDLRRVWKRAERGGQLIPVALVCRVMIEACSGLDHAHKKVDGNGKPLNIVHRDISPQNILLTFEGRVKVVDFGIAKAADQSTVTRSGVLKGKYSYMSPEQASGERVDRRTDIFALGVVLYELLTGTRLFRRASDMATLKAVAECDIPPPSQVSSRVPKDLDPIVMKALEREPGARYADALQFQLALEGWLATHPRPSSTAHVAAFMRDLYAARLAEEARSGDVLVEEGDPPSLSDARVSERSAIETMAARKGDSDVHPAHKESTDRLRSSRGEQRAVSSERKEQEPRRTVDIRRASPPDGVEEPGAVFLEKTVASSGAEQQQASHLSRKSNRLALVGIGAGVLVGLSLGGWWVLSSRSEPAPAPKPVVATAPRPAEPSPPAPAKPEQTRVVVILNVKPEQATLRVDGKSYQRAPVVVTATPGQELLVQVESPRHRSLSRKVTVGQGPMQDELLELEPLPEPSRVERKPGAVRATTTTVERPARSETRTGTVRFAVTPWADVTCGERHLGSTPLRDVSFVVGVYECKFSNPELGTKTRRVEVKPDGHTIVVVKF